MVIPCNVTLCEGSMSWQSLMMQRGAVADV